MLRFVRRGTEDSRPVGDYPPWLSALLRARGMDTPEKAERFLHPALEQLHPPLMMQDMDRAITLIRRAVAERQPVMIYGDYDVDGVCATSILLETLREEGALVDTYIPNRHGEGYGLNCDAVREIAKEHRLLITVDCGITNHQEVRLAQMLGMTVIVSDHHQPADTPSPADAVLNPLLGAYPFRRLCGAGVALKICQALQGMEGVQKRLELAALATVADIVPLVDENRVIVKLGLEAMAATERPGMRALLLVSGVTPPVNTGHVGFRLAPRLNAGGRLEDAAQGVRLLTATDAQEAERIAAHLEENNRTRQALEQEITGQALEAIAREVDFARDRVIVVMGEGWNSGVIGLAAGRICERYHWPTVVLSRSGDTAVGSCRSIPGVNIHAMLSLCKDLFQRFGGHEQAAGLTMDAALVPELRRRLSLAIGEHCDPHCFIPEKEYDLPLSLEQVDLELIDRLELLQPTGYGNPAPVFLARDASVQQARKVGNQGQHLKLSLAEGSALRDGIAFSMGEEADRGLTRVDVLFTPEKNTWRDRTSAQLQVKALIPAAGASPLPPEELFFEALLQEMTYLAENVTRLSERPRPQTQATVKRLLREGQGVLCLAHLPQTAQAFLVEYPGETDVWTGRVEDPRPFNALLCAPQLRELQDRWGHLVLLDGDTLPGERELLKAQCPRAELHTLRAPAAMKALMASLALEDEPLRELYRALRRGGGNAPRELARLSGLTLPQTLVGLTAFAQVRLAEFQLSPLTLRLLPPVKCAMADSALIRYLRTGAYLGKEDADELHDL